jgi:hypothetical protein
MPYFLHNLQSPLNKKINKKSILFYITLIKIHMSTNLFGNDLSAVATDKGPILDNIANQAVVSESVLTLLPDDTVTAVHISPFGKNLLNTTFLNTLRTSLLSDNEEAIAYNGGDNLQEINFHTYAQGQSAGA